MIFLTFSEFTDLMEHDVVPDPKIISAALRACRRINDFALTMRILEGVKIKSSFGVLKIGRKSIYLWLMQEVFL
jgi:cytochrome c oxidase subunit 5a